MLIIVGVVVYFIVSLVFYMVKERKRSKLAEIIQQEGFSIDYKLIGTNSDILIDKSAQMIAFVYSKTYTKIKFSEVTSLRHKLALAKKGVLEFKISNPDAPLIRVSCLTYSDACECSAILSALL